MQRKNKDYITKNDIIIYNENAINLFNFFMKNNHTTEKSNCLLDISSLLRSIEILFEGTNHNSGNKLNQILSLIPNSTYMRTGVFIHKDHKFETKYKRKLNKYGIFCGTIPYGYASINRVNKYMVSDWPDELEKFFSDDFNSNARIYIKDQSIFSAMWHEKFPVENTSDGPFYVDRNKTINIPMMKKDNYCETMLTYNYESKILGIITFVSMLYYNMTHSMLIIMPKNACNYQQLVTFISNELNVQIISDFYEKKLGEEITYTSKTMPKFEFKSQWNIDNKADNLDKINYLETLFHNNVDMSIMCKDFKPGTRESITLNSSSAIKNSEKGTFIKTETIVYEFDLSKAKSNEQELIIDKSFIYLILDEQKRICNIGIFAGN